MITLPPSWCRASLGEIASHITKGTTPTTNGFEFQSKGVNFIKIENIFGGRIDLTSIEQFISETAHQDQMRSSLRAGDILFSIAGTIGETAVVEERHLPANTNQALAIISGTEDAVVPKFIEYQLKSLSSRDLIAKARGGAMNNVSLGDLRNFTVALAPTAEQRRIVAKLEELFVELDKGRESLDAARGQLKAYRQSVLKDAFESRKTSVGGAWRETRLGQEIEFLTSGSRGWADYYATTGDTFIRAQNLKNDRLDLTDIAYVQLPPGNTEGVRTRVKIGDVLITITGANVTKTGIVSSDLGAAYVSQHVALCRPSASMMPAFLYWYLLSEAHGRRQLTEAAYGAGKPGLNLDNIRDVTLSLPSLEEQALIVPHIEAALEGEIRFLATIDGELQRIEALRQSVLTCAFSGSLVGQDPKDEPASVLLKRIHAQRESTPPRKGRKVQNGRKQAA